MQLEMAPQLIPSEKYTLHDQKLLYSDKLSRLNSSQVLSAIDQNIKLYARNDEIFALDSAKQQLVYLVKFIKDCKRFIDVVAGTNEHLHYVTQIRVFRDSTNTKTKGIAEEIFWQHLLPMTGLIVTDQDQTPDGRRFWGNRIGEAFDLDLKVGYWNQNNRQVLWFDNVDHYKIESDSLYKESDRSFQAHRLIIKG